MIRDIIIKILRKMGYSILKLDMDDNYLYFKYYNKSDIKNRRFYNIGAGLFRHPVWTNIDHYSEHYHKNIINIDFDLLAKKQLPIPDNSANIVYSSHTIEHLPDDSAQHMFNESYRILKNNGYIRITTPDTDLGFKTIENNDFFYWKWQMERADLDPRKTSLKQMFLTSIASQTTTIMFPNINTYKISDDEFDEIFSKYPYEQALDYCVSKRSLDLQRKHPGCHINWWNKEKVIRFLRNAGFENVYVSAYGQSLCPVMKNITYFDNTHPTVSLYVEARK